MVNEVNPSYTHWDLFRQEAACALAELGCDGMEGGLGELGPALSASQVGSLWLYWVGAAWFQGRRL